MIKFGDGAVLALTKLRTRPVRTAVTILLASLLFGVLIAASLIITGALQSVDRLREDGLTKRHIVGAGKVVADDAAFKTLRDPEVVAKAKKEYERLVEEKTAEAKRLGLTYIQASDPLPYTTTSDGRGEYRLDFRNPIANRLLAEKYAGQSDAEAADLTALAKKYNATDIFNTELYSVSPESSLALLQDGKEIFKDQTDSDYVHPTQKPSPISLYTQLAPSELTAPFMLPNNAGWKADGSSLPLILPQDSVEQLLGLKAPTSSASTKDKLNHLNTLKRRAIDATVTACYRNAASYDAIQQALQQQKYIKTSATNSDFVAPKVTYALPDDTSCTNPTVTSDTRTNQEKLHDANQKIFDKKFNNYVDPISHFVTFKVVGVSPPMSTSNSQNQMNNLGDIVNNLLSTSGVGQAVPKELYDQLPNKESFAGIMHYAPMYILGFDNNQQYYTEFAKATDAQRFISEQGCTTQYDGTCQPADHPYQLRLAFSNSAAIDDLQMKTREWFNYALVGIIILAAIIMWIAVGRTMSDSRRETAIFRAIGFKRGDIASTYIMYTAMLSALIAVFAVGIGVLGAYIVDRLYAPDLTVQAQYGFGALDLTKQVSLIGVDYRQLGLVLIACLVTGLLSVIIPLLRNVRRNPIRDMRDE